jgi:alkylation response protein AidB-like acyl-CoA dehydrogenase
VAQIIADRRDIEFVLYEQLGVETLCKRKKFGDLNRKMFDLVITEARNFAIKEMLPTFAESDRQGCRFEAGQVHVPESFHRLYELYRQGEWISMMEAPELGGQGIPTVVAQAVSEYFFGANSAFSLYPLAGHGAGKLVEIFGTETQKRLFLSKLYSGQWAGTMLLTESQAGSDVGALSTTAQKNADGTYSISGSKVFITGAEQDITENIIHPVLARIQGAPAGTSGISLFIVPKVWVNEDGSLGEPNDVVCTGIEEKMGIHGSATCSVTLGGKGGCRGLLLGEENKGMRAMFHMMNDARLGVGIQAFAIATAAFSHALNYARERVQGRHLSRLQDKSAPSVAIIEHPDVKRMLIWMKAYVEGMRSFVYYVGYLFDQVASAADEAEKSRCQDRIELLTPLIKAYCSDRAFEVCTQALQVFGGYGYCQEYPVEQLLRDCKITSIYEGTNGIQAMDLLGRKLGMKKGAVFMALLGDMKASAASARALPALAAMAQQVEAAVDKLGETALKLGQRAMSAAVFSAFSFASPFLEATGDVILAWMHLWRAQTAAEKLGPLAADARALGQKMATDKATAFYDGKLKTAEYFIRSLLPVTLGKLDAILDGSGAAVDIDARSW